MSTTFETFSENIQNSTFDSVSKVVILSLYEPLIEAMGDHGFFVTIKSGTYGCSTSSAKDRLWLYFTDPRTGGSSLTDALLTFSPSMRLSNGRNWYDTELPMITETTEQNLRSLITDFIVWYKKNV